METRNLFQWSDPFVLLQSFVTVLNHALIVTSGPYWHKFYRSYIVSLPKHIMMNLSMILIWWSLKFLQSLQSIFDGLPSKILLYFFLLLYS